jgi:hypothetical protein
MNPRIFIVLLLLAAAPKQTSGGLVLAGDAIRFDDDLRPRFTANQVTSTAAATRAGLVRWAGTAAGREIIRRFQEESERTVIIKEDPDEPTPGRAPQPSIETLLGARNRKVQKRYELILNPTIASQYDNAGEIDLGLPRTSSDVMALAWAGEMLHIDFYADGVSLPHHDRGDFQERWLAVAAQLGLPNTAHGTESH